MRTISAASLAKLATKTGTEPITLVEIKWTDGAASHWYAGKDIHGIAEGRLLAVSTIDDVVNYSNSGTSQNVTITLNDTDKKLLNIFGNVDIHKRPVKVWQWFDGIPFSDKFLLFSGIMASPIQWKEGDRSFTFTVLSRLEDFEVGFAPEEGFFPFVPDAIIGRAWPLVFGHVMKLPCIPLDDFPSGNSEGSKVGGASDSMTKDATGIHDPSLDKKIKDNELNQTQAARLAQLMFLGYLEASFTARKLGELGDLDPIRVGSGTFSGLAKQYLDAGNKFLLQSQKIGNKNESLRTTLQKQKAEEKDAIGVTNGSNFPQGRNVDLNVGGARHSGYFVGDTYNITERVHPNSEITEGMLIPEVDQRVGDPLITRDKFFFMNAGTPLRFSQNSSTIDPDNPDHPIRYVVSSGIAVTVSAVYAYRTVGGLKSIYAVPPAYYQVIQTHFGTLPVTMIYMLQALSTHLGSDGVNLGYDNDIWATVVSPIGPNTIDIMKWLIDTYTSLTYDPTTFASVRISVSPFPMNFAVMDQPSLIKLLQDIAYQARCILWLKGDIFYIKYLPKADTSVATITEAEVLLQSLEVGCTPTEDLVTKYVANWRPDYLSQKPWKTILRYNILFYGLHEQSVNYTCFNQLALVHRAATFWMIRTANTYKTLTIKVPFTHLNIETLDTITLNFSRPWIARTSIPAVVMKATIDTVNYEVTLELWLPVRLGEMVQYNFAFPSELAIQDLFPSEADQQQGRTSPSSELNRDVRMPTDSKISAPMSGDEANGGGLHVSFRPLTWGDGAIGDSQFSTPDIVTRIDSTQINAVGQTPAGTTQYQYDQQKVEAAAIIAPVGATYPAFVETVNDNNTYDLHVFYKGLNGPPTPVSGVKQVNNTTPLKVNDGIMVTRTVFKDAQNKDIVEHVMQGGGAGGNSTLPGIVSEANGDGTYIVDVYERGSLNPPTTIFSVRQVVGDNDSPLAEGTGVMVTRLSFVNDDNSTGVEYVMQAPVWS